MLPWCEEWTWVRPQPSKSPRGVWGSGVWGSSLVYLCVWYIHLLLERLMSASRMVGRDRGGKRPPGDCGPSGTYRKPYKHCRKQNIAQSNSAVVVQRATTFTASHTFSNRIKTCKSGLDSLKEFIPCEDGSLVWVLPCCDSLPPCPPPSFSPWSLGGLVALR
jgi:hypothetical protein